MRMLVNLLQRLLLLSLLLPAQAMALSCSADIQDMSFGGIDVLGSGNPLATSTSQVTVRCQRGLLELGSAGDITVCVHIGAGAGGTASGARQLLSGSNKLLFNLYADASGTTPWGSATVFSAPGPRKFLLSLPLLVLEDNDTAPIYGRISGSQSGAVVGTYLSSFAGANTEVRYGAGNLSCSALSASTLRAPFTVDAVVMPNCSVSADVLDFGTTTSLSGAVDAIGRISSTCTRGAAYQISLDNGKYAQGSTRRMASGSDRVSYELYRDPSRSQRWGMLASSEAVAGVGTGTVTDTPVYGRVPAQTGMAVGSYADTVVAIISF